MIKTVYRIMSSIIALAVVFTVYATAHAAQTIYYVSAIGVDSNPGTSSAPFRTIQKAVNMAAAGDTMIVSAGTYPEYVNITKSA